MSDKPGFRLAPLIRDSKSGNLRLIANRGRLIIGCTTPAGRVSYILSDKEILTPLADALEGNQLYGTRSERIIFLDTGDVQPIYRPALEISFRTDKGGLAGSRAGSRPDEIVLHFSLPKGGSQPQLTSESLILEPTDGVLLLAALGF